MARLGAVFAVNVDGAGVVEKLTGAAVWIATVLELGVELIEWNYFC